MRGLYDAIDDAGLEKEYVPRESKPVEKVGFTAIAPSIPLSTPKDTPQSLRIFSSQKAVSGPKNATVFLKNVERIIWKTRMSFQRVDNGAFTSFLFKEAPRVPFKGDASATITFGGHDYTTDLERSQNPNFVIYTGGAIRIVITRVSQFAYGRVQIQLITKENVDEDEEKKADEGEKKKVDGEEEKEKEKTDDNSSF